ncbi:unnamed protein product [Prorocentrum cordatum]|uniref:Uncharacterized protein n=1 Tax=Prorocentrum cordatum TaxID=2364126 RepID=A0ABN9SNR1_9DINO|nr:unnamed protein product [Polarella glacialis]
MAMVTAIEEAINEVKPIIMEVIAQHEASGDDEGTKQIMVAAEGIIKLLVGKKLATEKVWIKILQVGTHQENRFGVGLEVTDVHDFLEVIIFGGFGYDKCVGAVCFEMAPSGKAREAQWAFNEPLTSSSSGYLPAFEPPDLKYLSVTCSHTVAGARCVAPSAKGTMDQILDDRGNIAREKVMSICSSYEQPLVHGMPWTVICREVDAAIPELASFLQEADNADHGANRQQSKMQTLLQIHRMSNQHQKTFGEVRWHNSERQIERIRPHLKGQVADLCSFVELYSGGVDGCLLSELHAFAQTVGDCRRDVHGSTFGMLAKLKYMAGPGYMTACIKARLCAPASQCRDGVARMLSSADLAVTKGSKKADVAAFLATTAAAKSFLKTLTSVPAAARANVLGHMQVRCIHMVHNKQAKGQKKYQNVGGIKDTFLDEVEALCAGATAEGPWARSGAPGASGSTSSPPARGRGLVQFSATSSGMVLSDAALRDLGFKTGAVACKASADADKSKSVIFDIADGKVTLQPCEAEKAKGKKRKADDDESTVETDNKVAIASSELADEYEVAPANAVVRVPINKNATNTCNLKDCQLERLRSQVRLALLEAYDSNFESVDVTIALHDRKNRPVPIKPPLKDAGRPIAPRCELPEQKQPTATHFVVHHWCAQAPSQGQIANVVRTFVKVAVAIEIGSKSVDVTLDIPATTNSRVVKAGDVLAAAAPAQQASPNKA